MSVEEAKRVVELLEAASNMGLTLHEDEKIILKRAKAILERINKKK